jgi:hypothetical protein
MIAQINTPAASIRIPPSMDAVLSHISELSIASPAASNRVLRASVAATRCSLLSYTIDRTLGVERKRVTPMSGTSWDMPGLPEISGPC